MLTRENIAETMIQWMKEEKWICNEVKDPQYQILYTVSDGQTTIFVGIEKEVERVSIHKRLDLTLDAQNSYRLSLQKYDFWFDLKVRLILLGVNITAIPDFDSPNQIDLFERIYFDAFTRDRFIHTIINIINGNGLFNYMWQRFVKSQQSGTIDGNGQ